MISSRAPRLIVRNPNRYPGEGQINVTSYVAIKNVKDKYMFKNAVEIKWPLQFIICVKNYFKKHPT